MVRIHTYKVLELNFMYVYIINRLRPGLLSKHTCLIIFLNKAASKMNWLRRKVMGAPAPGIDEAAAHLTLAHEATESRCNEIRREIQLCETRKSGHIAHGNEEGVRAEYMKQKQLRERLRKLEGVGTNTRRQAASVQDAALYAKTIKAQRVSMQAQSEEYKTALNGDDIDKVMQEMEEWQEQEEDVAQALSGDVLHEMDSYDDDDELAAQLAAARSNEITYHDKRGGNAPFVPEQIGVTLPPLPHHVPPIPIHAPGLESGHGERKPPAVTERIPFAI